MSHTKSERVSCEFCQLILSREGHVARSSSFRVNRETLLNKYCFRKRERERSRERIITNEEPRKRNNVNDDVLILTDQTKVAVVKIGFPIEDTKNTLESSTKHRNSAITMIPSATLSALSSRVPLTNSSFSSSKRKKGMGTIERKTKTNQSLTTFVSFRNDDDAVVESDNRGDSESTRRRTVLATSTAMFALFNAQPATAKLKGRTGGIPIENFRDLPGAPGIKYYDIKGGGGDNAVPFPKGTRVAVHYDLKFRSLTIASSRVGAGVTGGDPYGFNVGAPSASPGGPFIPAFNYGIQGMGVGTVRRMLVPAEYAYGNNQVQEIPPNSEVTLDLELLSIAKTGLSK